MCVRPPTNTLGAFGHQRRLAAPSADGPYFFISFINNHYQPKRVCL